MDQDFKPQFAYALSDPDDDTTQWRAWQQLALADRHGGEHEHQ